MPSPVRVVSDAASEQVPVLFHTLRMYALPVALKSAGSGNGSGGGVLKSCGRAKAKYALGDPTKLGMSSVAVPVPAGGSGSGKTTSTPSTLILKTICGRLVPASSHVDTLLTSYVTTLAPAGTEPAAATWAALVFDVPVVGL